jgi:hypothetical protein
MRDYQRSKVYAWESKYLPRGRLVPFREIQEYVNTVWEGFGLKHPPRVALLPKQARIKCADATRTVVRFEAHGATEIVILHELAHSMTTGIGALGHQHNEYFVGMFMTLIERVLKINLNVLWYTAQKANVKFDCFTKPRIVDDEILYGG